MQLVNPATWLKRKEDSQQIPELVNLIIETTPASWQQELSEKVRVHLTKYAH